MKKFVCLLAVLALSVPVFAQTVTLSVGTDGVIGYSSDAAADENPVGIALVATATGGMITGASDFSGEFTIYLDYAYTMETGGSPYELGAGHPLAAAQDAPGAFDIDNGFPVAEVVICMGRLTDPPSAGPASDSLITLAADNNTEICVDAEATYRGGIVSAKEGVELIVVGACETIGVGCGTCTGDLDGDGVVTLAGDLMPFIAIMQNNGFANMPVGDRLCMDRDGDGLLTLAGDLMPMIAILQNNGFANMPCP